MDDCVMVQSQDYAQVIFEDLKDAYTENQDLECLFSFNDLVKMDSSDWIGIYKVGFTNCKDYICKQSIKIDSISESRGKVVFPSDQIPKSDNEFYQFVYISQSKQIRGASIPFQFKKVYLSDFVECEEDQEAIVYKSKDSLLNETYIEMKQQNEHLVASNESQAKLIKQNEEIIDCLKEELSTIKLKCLKLSLDNERVNHTLKIKTDEVKNLQDQINLINQEKNDLINNGQIENLEKKVQDQVDELAKLRDQLKRNEQIVLDQSKTIQSIVGEKDNLSYTITKILTEKSDLETNNQNLRQDITILKEKLSAAEQCKEMLRSQLTVVTNELNESNEKNQNLSYQISEYIAKNKNTEMALNDVNDKFHNLKADCENKLNEQNGSYYALKLAHTHLETKYKNQEKDLEKSRMENEELKERIKTGAKEYSKLYEKYRLLKNKQFNHDLNVYTDLCGNEHLVKRNESLSTDSAIQGGSSQRVSTTDIENTLLDALLNSSLGHNQPKKSTSTAVGIVNMREQFGNLSANNTLTSDDGLINRQNNESDIFENRILRSCEICNHEFPTGSSLQDIEKHYNEQHYGPSCPVCYLSFRKGYPQSDFEKHVNEHFAN
ncbi:unnamed protein product [Brachionus calyciflorus]|uniref:SKICH domain-containing protein n=1 Tax=Brachionus calyciflorus TaxID=104777 RepID=A0A814KMQ3_9BILA|nr:unnamed protein product [Brachionus calyciflorus]